MNYKVSSLTTKADCQVLIDNADRVKSELEFKRVTIGHQADIADTNNVDIAARFSRRNGRTGCPANRF